MLAVDIHLHFSLDAEDTEEVRNALANLADVMLVQAEDGLYLLGSPDTENPEVVNVFLGDLNPPLPKHVKQVSVSVGEA